MSAEQRVAALPGHCAGCMQRVWYIRLQWRDKPHFRGKPHVCGDARSGRLASLRQTYDIAMQVRGR